MSKLDELLNGGAWPTDKDAFKSLIENIDPDLPYDIMYFFTDSIYAEHSLDEKVQLAKDRIDEYHERVKEL